MNTKLYRSKTISMVGGVCGGLAQYLNVDVTLVRLFFVLLTLAGGSGVLLYIIMWIVIPLEGQEATTMSTTSIHPGNNQGLVVGAALLIIGVLFLMQNVAGSWAPWLGIGTLWPLLLILLGGALLWNRTKGV